MAAPTKNFFTFLVESHKSDVDQRRVTATHMFHEHWYSSWKSKSPSGLHLHISAEKVHFQIHKIGLKNVSTTSYSMLRSIAVVESYT